ncbi:hypothetical protein [Roseovarius faecimaris]|nr:hypothetical protein [Roseovarius faecimaris]
MTNASETLPVKLPLWPEDKAAKEALADALGNLEGGALDFVAEPEIGLDVVCLRAADERVLEDMVHRLLTVYGIRMRVGAPAIAYRATIKGRAEDRFEHEVKRRGERYVMRVEVRVAPDDPEQAGVIDETPQMGSLGAELAEHLRSGLQSVLDCAPLETSPLYGLRVQVTGVEALTPSVLPSGVATAARICLRRCVKAAGLVLLEPIMRLEVHAPVATEASVINDIRSRRGRVIATDDAGDSSLKIKAELPMANLFGYINTLHHITDGAGRFEARFSHYQRVPGSDDPDDAPPLAMAM